MISLGFLHNVCMGYFIPGILSHRKQAHIFFSDLFFYILLLSPSDNGQQLCGVVLNCCQVFEIQNNLDFSAN